MTMRPRNRRIRLGLAIGVLTGLAAGCPKPPRAVPPIRQPAPEDARQPAPPPVSPPPTTPGQQGDVPEAIPTVKP